MRFTLVKAICFAIAPILVAIVQADLCAMGRKEIDGNWFCQAVNAIQYSNVGHPGVYQKVVDMAANGTCTQAPKAFSGPIAPLDEELSLHFRGPIRIKQIAVYTPMPSQDLSKRERNKFDHRYVHQHRHIPAHHYKEDDTQGEIPKREVISATINGQVVSWENNYFGPDPHSSTRVVPESQWVTATINGQVVSWLNNWFGPASSGPATVQTPPATVLAVTTLRVVKTPDAQVEVPKPTAIAAANYAGAFGQKPPVGPNFHAKGSFQRISYYHAESQTAENIVFLGNHGGQGSGVFDLNFGASISYVDSSGTRGSATSQILADVLIPSDAEVTVMFDKKCEDGDCGYFRPGAVANHGFAGADKVFMLEFSMPHDGQDGFNGDKPAFWMLNANIPRTLQYGKAECSCWQTGCGEFDVFEALMDGSDWMKSTVHTNAPGGDSDYIGRPTDTTMKAAVVFSSSTSTIHIQVLEDDVDFASTFSAKQINNMCSAHDANLVSHFAITG